MSALAGVPRGTKKRTNGQAGPPAPAIDPAWQTLQELPLDKVDVGENVRVDPGELEDLAASIRELGVLQPIRAIGPDKKGRYRAVWGQRRLLASKIAGRSTIPALVEESGLAVDAAGPRRSIEQLVENIQRADLGPIDEAYALRQILDADADLTQAELAKRLGRSAPWVANTLALLEAPKPIQEMIANGELTASHQKALKGLAAKTQLELAKDAIRYGESAHRLEERVQQHKRSEEWRQERQAQEAEQAKAKAAGQLAAIEKKLGKKPKDTPIVITEGYMDGGRTGHVKKLLADQGYTNVKVGRVSTKPPAPYCTCTVTKVEITYSQTLTITPGCIVQKHQQAKTDGDDRARRAAYQLETDVKARIHREAPSLVAAGAAGSRTVVMEERLARMALWNLLGWRIQPWGQKRGAKPAGYWQAIVELTPDELAAEIASAIAAEFGDHFSYRVDWPALAEHFGVKVPLPAPAAGFAPAQAAAAAAEMDAEGLT